MSISKTAVRLALAAALAVTAVASPAVADSLSGWGTRDWNNYHSSFMGDVTKHPDGTLTGHFTIVTFNDNEETIFCRYTRFRANSVGGNFWNFDGWGVCISGSSGGYYAVSNRFAIVDFGSPGVGIDYIDVNYYGPVGVSIPGGYLQSGDLIWTP